MSNSSCKEKITSWLCKIEIQKIYILYDSWFYCISLQKVVDWMKQSKLKENQLQDVLWTHIVCKSYFRSLWTKRVLITYRIFTTSESLAKKIFEIMNSSHSISTTTTNFLFSRSFWISLVTSWCKMSFVSSLHHALNCSEWLFNKTTRFRMFSDIFKSESSKWKCFSWIDFRNFSILISLKKYEQHSNDESIIVDSNSQSRKLSWRRWMRNEKHWIKKRLKISSISCHVAFRRFWLQMMIIFITKHHNDLEGSEIKKKNYSEKEKNDDFERFSSSLISLYRFAKL